MGIPWHMYATQHNTTCQVAVILRVFERFRTECRQKGRYVLKYLRPQCRTGRKGGEEAEAEEEEE
jgi:hypothetical protein